MLNPKTEAIYCIFNQENASQHMNTATLQFIATKQAYQLIQRYLSVKICKLMLIIKIIHNSQLVLPHERDLTQDMAEMASQDERHTYARLIHVSATSRPAGTCIVRE